MGVLQWRVAACEDQQRQTYTPSERNGDSISPANSSTRGLTPPVVFVEPPPSDDEQPPNIGEVTFEVPSFVIEPPKISVLPDIVIEVTGPEETGSRHSSRAGSGSGGSRSLSPDAAQLEQALEYKLGGFTIVVTNEDNEEVPLDSGRGTPRNQTDGSITPDYLSRSDRSDDESYNEENGKERKKKKRKKKDSYDLKKIIEGKELGNLGDDEGEDDDEDDEQNGYDSEEEEDDEQRCRIVLSPAVEDDGDHDSGILC